MGVLTMRIIDDLFAHTKEDENGCWIWQGALSREGYGKVRSRNGRYLSTHRAAYEVQHGPIPEGMLVCHKCDVRKCIRPSHLWLGTHLENLRDRDAKGRGRPLRGTRNPSAKLTQADVERIRALYSTGKLSCAKIAQQFGVARQTVHAIVLRRKWRPERDVSMSEDVRKWLTSREWCDGMSELEYYDAAVANPWQYDDALIGMDRIAELRRRVAELEAPTP
jgi:hypothetical protein